MAKRLIGLCALSAAATVLPGCVAAAIPALAGTAMVGKDMIGNDREERAAEVETPAAPDAQARPAAAPDPAPAPAPPTPPPPTQAPVADGAPAAAPAMEPEATPPAASAPEPPSPVQGQGIAPYPDPDAPIGNEHRSFARFVRYGQASALAARQGADLVSAILADPVALDGKRRRCAAGEQPIALIDLDPAGGLFAPPAAPAAEPGLALGLALLRAEGVEIAWFTDLQTGQSGALRAALEQSGLDPRGQDIISMRRDETDSKQKRRDSLAGIACIVAIAGDERPDFDERFKYLRTPEAGAGLDPLIGDGWFLVEPILTNQGQ